MNTIVTVKVGSHLYGTATPTSDLDIKGIYLPAGRDILLQRVSPSISIKRAKALGEKNTAQDVDYELYCPAKYLLLLAQGQSIVLEMLFAPDSALLGTPHPAWDKIKALAPLILTKQAASFVHYCNQQANKYCIKGAPVTADWKTLSHVVRIEHQAIEFLQHHRITFPRPEAEHLLDIRLGKIDFEQVAQEIEQLLRDVNDAQENSTLPEHYDQAIIDNFIEQLYLEQVQQMKLSQS